MEIYGKNTRKDGKYCTKSSNMSNYNKKAQ